MVLSECLCFYSEIWCLKLLLNTYNTTHKMSYTKLDTPHPSYMGARHLKDGQRHKTTAKTYLRLFVIFCVSLQWFCISL